MRFSLFLFQLFALTAFPTATAAEDDPFPDVIDLPNGFFPEGLAIGRGQDFYVGSLANGSIYKGNLGTGEGEILVPSPDPSSSFGITSGLSVDSFNRVWVAGGLLGNGRVYDGESGQLLKSYTFTDVFSSLINDVIATEDAVYFTDAGTGDPGVGEFAGSPRVFIVRLGPDGTLPEDDDPSAIEEIYVSVNTGQELDIAFPNLNGIETAPEGQGGLIVCHTTLGVLLYVDSVSGEAFPIDVGEYITCDGLVRRGTTLYAVDNPAAKVVVVNIDPQDMTQAVVERRYNIPGADTPTTAGLFGNDLYVTDFRSNIPQDQIPTTAYKVYKVEL